MIKTSAASVYENNLFKQAAKKKETVEERSLLRRAAGGLGGVALATGGSLVGGAAGYGISKAMGASALQQILSASAGSVVGSMGATGLMASEAREQYDNMTPRQQKRVVLGRPNPMLGTIIGHPFYYGQKII